jgi:hypothetical protein
LGGARRCPARRCGAAGSHRRPMSLISALFCEWQIDAGLYAIAKEQKVVRGRRMRVDTTVVEAVSTTRRMPHCSAMACES